ncbi:CoA transferase [Caulobacter endophyticus]|uniref:CoA transferase n=1 Tax=Caulobacter endophyticus TaxID=2172652 RepID=A0A2T9JGX3_9CAUL|nr:CoA transferase [Caulobacter endophyticus]
MTPLLSGIRVVELSAVVMGPFAGQILADLGAEVIKIEPLGGDIARTAAPVGAGGGAMFLNNNRNKKVIAVDLKSAEGQAIAQRLVEECDVLLHNMRVDAIERLGLGFEAARALNPAIIHCSAIGFGQGGRYRDLPAFDDIIQAASGLAGLSTNFGHDPQFVPTNLADKVGALYTVYGVLAALVARAGGRREAMRIEAPMFEAVTSFLLNEHLAGATFGETGEGMGYKRLFARDRRPYRTLDGWLAVLPYTQPQWTRFFAEAGRSDILEAPWFADPVERNRRIGALYGELSGILATRSTRDWVETLTRLDIPCSPVRSMQDLIDDPHLADIGFFTPSGDYPPDVTRALPQPVVFEGVERVPDRAAPSLGADTREILAACGYDQRQIDGLAARGVIHDGAVALLAKTGSSAS